MTSKEALNTICSECQKYKGKIQVACPFRSISNDYCDEYEQIKKDLEILECFKKLFEGEDLDGWIEFNFYANVSYINKIKEWLRDDK